MKTIIAFIVLCFGLFIASSAGDILHLTNGMAFDGKVTKLKKCSIIFQTEIGSFIIPAEDIQRLEFMSPTSRLGMRYVNKFNPDNCLAGKMDAKLYHKKTGLSFSMGFLFGPFALLGILIASPNPDKGRETLQKSDNEHLFDDPHYLQCYRRKAKGRMAAMAAVGWGVWLAILVLIGAL